MLMAVFCSTLLDSQQVDSFYLRVLERGEQYYMEADYTNALDKLKVAIFGLYGATEHQAKAYVYMCLSYFYLKDAANSEKYLKEAEQLMTTEELLDLDITESARNDLERLVYTLRAGNNPIAGLKMLPKIPDEGLLVNTHSDQSQLIQGIRENPRNPSLYYKLYNIYRENYNYQGAKKTIEDLVEKNPNEMYGYYLFGIVQYQDKEFKDALSSFDNFFKLSAGLPVREVLLTEVIAYQVLSNYLRGDRNKANELVDQHAASLTRERIRTLPLSEKDKRMLQGIVDTYLR
jgi:tetratricopeptide (TPR) repeat protein